MNKLPRPLKRVTVCEELVELTKDPTLAIILNQFFLYARSAKDFDKMLEEESRIRVIGPIAEEMLDINVSPRYDWIYKRVSDLLSDTMLNTSHTTMRRCITTLVKNGWLKERKNPFNKWDQSKQFRCNISKLQHDLRALGYPLDGFPLDKQDDKRKLAL